MKACSMPMAGQFIRELQRAAAILGRTTRATLSVCGLSDGGGRTQPIGGRPMDAKALVTLALIGLVAGFLASLLMGGGGLVRFLVSGVAGAFVGGFLLNAIGVNLGIKNPLISQILTATIGAIVVIIVARFIA